MSYNINVGDKMRFVKNGKVLIGEVTDVTRTGTYRVVWDGPNGRGQTKSTETNNTIRIALENKWLTLRPTTDMLPDDLFEL